MYPASMFRDAFRVPVALYRIILGDLIAFNPRRSSTRTDAFWRRVIRAEVKLVCIRLIWNARSLRYLYDGAQMGKELFVNILLILARHS